MILFQIPAVLLTVAVFGVTATLLLTGGMARMGDSYRRKRGRVEISEEERAQRAEAHRSMGLTVLLTTVCIAVFTEAFFRGMQGLAIGAVLAMPVAGMLSILYAKSRNK